MKNVHAKGTRMQRTKAGMRFLRIIHLLSRACVKKRTCRNTDRSGSSGRSDLEDLATRSTRATRANSSSPRVKRRVAAALFPVNRALLAAVRSCARAASIPGIIKYFCVGAHQKQHPRLFSAQKEHFGARARLPQRGRNVPLCSARRAHALCARYKTLLPERSIGDGVQSMCKRPRKKEIKKGGRGKGQRERRSVRAAPPAPFHVCI